MSLISEFIKQNFTKEVIDTPYQRKCFVLSTYYQEYSKMNQPSNFDPSLYLDATTTQAATRRPPVPVGDYDAVISDLKVTPWVKKDDPTKSGMMLALTLNIDLTPYPAALEVVNKDAEVPMTSIKLFENVFLDTTNTGLDFSPGKNSRLRRYREALNMNQPGQAFSMRQMDGRMVKVKVKHEIYNGDTQERIDSVAAV